MGSHKAMAKRGYTEIIGWGDKKQDCIDHLEKHPELKKQGYSVMLIGNVWVVGKAHYHKEKQRMLRKRKSKRPEPETLLYK